MKQYFLLLSILAILHLSKAGPLRLHKRAAFYIANETACVVDNIVYSNGDPIPTDDPCEACKCRPPGFACVLKDCKVKQGCRAVRQVGHCCPEYVCDTPERGSFIGGNALPPANLLPELYELDVLPEIIPSTEMPESTTKQTDPPQTTTEEVKYEARIPGEKESLDEVIKLETTESTVEETKSSDPEVEETSTHIDKEESIDNVEIKTTNSESSEENIAVGETKVLLNSEYEIKADDDAEITTVKVVSEDETTRESSSISTETSIPETREELLTTIANKIESVESDAEVTTKRQLEVTLTSTEIPVTEKQVKNSAADNSKSLKLSDVSPEEPLNNTDAKEDKVVESEKSSDETETSTSASSEESSSKVELDSIKVDDITEKKPESEENVAEESQTDPQTIPFYANDKIIKKESAETVTIVVHVREKTKIPTETDFATKVTDAPINVTESILLKSNELGSTEISTESTENEGISSSKNFEVFASPTETSKESTASPPPEPEKIEARSEEIDSTVPIVETTSTDGKSDVNTGEDVSVISTTQSAKDITEVSKEARTDEEKSEETKENDPKEAEIEEKDQILIGITETDPKVAEIAVEESKVTDIEQPNVAIKIETITNPETQTTVIEAAKEPEKIADEEKKLEEKGKETKPEGNAEETHPEEKVIGTKPEEKEEETKPEQREENVEKTNIENKKTEENEENKTEETNNQGSEKSSQPEETKDSE